MEDEQLSNWGRWGTDDQRGTLNYITPATIKRAKGLIKKGRVYSLACTVGGDGPYIIGAPRPGPPWRYTAITNMPSPNQAVHAEDMIAMSSHSGTHIDALSHVWYDQRMYNGFSASNVQATGTSKNSIQNVKSLVGRGIMLDVAGNKGVKHLERGYAITGKDLDDCLAAEGLKTEPGDIILVRTGLIQVFYAEGVIAFQGALENISEPGLSYRVAWWLHERQACAVGLDNFGAEVFPCEVPDNDLPFHRIFIRDLGGYIMELLDLEELARNKVYEFLFMAAPLQISGGLGGPINPLAIV